MKFITIGLACVVIFASQSYSQIALIANKNVSLQINSIQQVADIYTLDTKASGGTNLVVYDVKKGIERKVSYVNR
jgi:site-specific recombinase